MVGECISCFFSSNYFNGPDYDISYAVSESVGDPYMKSAAPLLVSGGDGGRLNSPGGATVAPGPPKVTVVGQEGTTMVLQGDETPGNSSVRQIWTGMMRASGTIATI